MTLEEAVEQVERVSEGRNLLENLRLINLETWKTSQEVFADWQKGIPVEMVHTANLAVYRLVNHEVVFDLLGREGNPFCNERFQEEVYYGLWKNVFNFFSPQGAMKEHIQAAIQPYAAVRYSGLRMKTNFCDPNYGYVEVDGENRTEEKKLFERVDGTKNHDRGKRVYILRDYVVRNALQGNEDDLIVRAGYFLNILNFKAIDWDMTQYSSAVCGVRRETVIEGDAKKN